MQSKTFLTSLAFIVVTTVSASAMCSDKSHQAMSCGEGMTWDHEQGACVEQTIS